VIEKDLPALEFPW